MRRRQVLVRRSPSTNRQDIFTGFELGDQLYKTTFICTTLSRSTIPGSDLLQLPTHLDDGVAQARMHLVFHENTLALFCGTAHHIQRAQRMSSLDGSFWGIDLVNLTDAFCS